MKKKGTKQWMAVLTVLLAAMFMIISVGCGAEKKEIVDETDMSRWVVRFSSNYECDLQNEGEDAEIWGWEEKTVAELREMHISETPFTIRYPYREEYWDMAQQFKTFTLEPEVELWYISDSGERIKNGTINGDEYTLHRFRIEPPETSAYRSRIVSIGRYTVEYMMCKNLSDFGPMTMYEITRFYIDVIVEE